MSLREKEEKGFPSPVMLSGLSSLVFLSDCSFGFLKSSKEIQQRKQTQD